MDLPNRFVRSATSDHFTDGNGYTSDKKVAFYSEVAQGGAGLIVSGITSIHTSGQHTSTQASIAGEEYVAGFKKLTQAVHEGGAKIALQLYHAGREAGRYRRIMNQDAFAPSLIADDPNFKGKYRVMTETEIWMVIRAYGDAARRAREAGFDAVQVHGAHAYLPSQFLSPFTNRRTDEWGGILENRLRFHREIYRDVRKKVGEDYPVLIKLGVEDGFSGGLRFREGLQAAKAMAEWGMDAIEISQGLRGANYEGTEFRTGIDNREKEAYFREWCRQVKREVRVLVMMVGGLRTFDLMEEVLINGEADFVSLCRPLIREPGIIKEWKNGSRRSPACISCNQCLESLRENDLLQCVFNQK